MSQQSGNFIFHPLQNGNLTHEHSSGRSSGYPNIVQYKPDGVSGIFAPRIVVHGRNYSSNQGTNQNNSLPEASNSHTHFDAHYPAGQTVSAQRQQLAAEQAAQKERDDLYAKLFGSLLTGSDSGSGTEANSEENNYYELLSTRMDKVQECEQDGTKRIQNYSICPPNDIVGEHIIKDTIVCCKKPTSLGGTGSGFDSSGDSGGTTSATTGGSTTPTGGTTSATTGGSTTPTGGTTSATTGGSTAPVALKQCDGIKPRWLQFNVNPENRSTCNSFCDSLSPVKPEEGRHTNYCLKPGAKLGDKTCSEWANEKNTSKERECSTKETNINQNCELKYKFRENSHIGACKTNNCRSYQAHSKKDGKTATSYAHELGLKRHVYKENVVEADQEEEDDKYKNETPEEKYARMRAWTDNNPRTPYKPNPNDPWDVYCEIAKDSSSCCKKLGYLDHLKSYFE